MGTCGADPGTGVGPEGRFLVFPEGPRGLRPLDYQRPVGGPAPSGPTETPPTSSKTVRQSLWVPQASPVCPGLTEPALHLPAEPLPPAGEGQAPSANTRTQSPGLGPGATVCLQGCLESRKVNREFGILTLMQFAFAISLRSLSLRCH